MRQLEMDRTLCKLASLGQILTQVTTAEDQPLHPECLADLGRVIEEQAHAALEILNDPPRDPVSNGSQS